MASTTSFSLHLLVTLAAAFFLVPYVQPLIVYFSGNEDRLSLPGLLLFASVLHVAIGVAPDILWNIDPAIGLFMGSGLPWVSIPTMQKVDWVANACHFVPGIRKIYGKSNFWIPSDLVSQSARAESLSKALAMLSPVVYEPSNYTIDNALWSVNSAGLFEVANSASRSPSRMDISISPSTRDFLLFAAIHYHAFWEWEVQVLWKGQLAFTTKGTDSHALFDVDSETMAVPIVAAQLVRRPHSQSPLRGTALHEGDHEYGPYIISLDSLSRIDPVCAIDFHSYAEEYSKVSASLNELAGAYYRVIQYIKHSVPPVRGLTAHVQVGQTLWIAILGGAILDSGRLTIQNLPGTWGAKNISPDEAYLSRITAILDVLKPYAKQTSFFDLVFSGGSTRQMALVFLFLGLLAQIFLCFLLSAVGNAGVWMSVALANTLMTGKLLDLHSLYWGKTIDSQQPGMKMYLPGSKELMAIATFDRTGPRDGPLRPGIFLNLVGIAAAVLGVIFKDETRHVLGFAGNQSLPTTLLYVAMFFTVGLSSLIGITIYFQQVHERTWANNSELPNKWMVYTTLSCSMAVAGFGFIFHRSQLTWLWPVLDALIWASGLPLGMLENGRISSGDESTIQMILVNRWLMGLVSSIMVST
ncbi:hypothetical protein L208DRAFT_223883 [Tricholoma matsutake]|nr:hypothetical protein L208DRAFT_223883 [Tricholoma matsutake 945]